MPLVMGVASLAASTRVEVRDADDGRLVASGTARHPGVATGEIPPEQQVDVWWHGLADAVRAAGTRGDIGALGVAAQRGALVLLDRVGSPLGPASLRTDSRAIAVADDLVRRLGADRLARATGHRTGTDTPLARLVWRVGVDAWIAEEVDAVLGAADFLVARLTGRRVTDRASASTTGWWDGVANRWRADLLRAAVHPAPAAGWIATLPPVLEPAEPADWVGANVPGVVRLGGRPLVAPGTSDVAARALGASVGPGAALAVLDDDDAMVVAGASAPVGDPSGRVVGLADAAGHYLPTVALGSVGAALDGVARLLGTDATGLAWRAKAAAGELDGRGPVPVVLPARQGGPGARPPGRPGAAVGLNGETTAEELAWAALLGVGAEILEALDAIEQASATLSDGGPLVLAGSIARRPGVAAAVAELAGRDVVVSHFGAAATGACVQAAASLRGTNPLEVARAWALDSGQVIEPTDSIDAAACLDAHAEARARLRPDDQLT